MTGALPMLLAAALSGEPAEYPHHETLRNGLRLSLCPSPGLPKVALKLSFEITVRDDPPGMDGVHLVAFHSTAAARWQEWARRVEVLGGWWDPVNLFPEAFGQDLVLPSKDWEEGVRILREVLEAASGETEEKALPAIRECLEHHRKQLPSESRTDLLDREGFSEPFAGLRGKGSREGLSRASEADVLAFRRRHLVPARARITAVGDFDPALLLEHLRREFGGVPNPEGAVREAAVLRDFRSGRRILALKETPGAWEACVRVGYPIPPEVSSAEGLLLATLLRPRVEGARAEIEADLRPGQRLLRFRADGPDPVEVLEALDGRIRAFPGGVDPSTLRKAVDLVKASQAKRLSSAYWLSWAVAFPSEPLGWEGSHPVLAYRSLDGVDLGRLAAISRAVLDPSRRLVLQVAESRDEEERLRTQAEAATPGFPAAPPAPTPAFRIAKPVSPQVRVCAGGDVLFWEDPLLDGYKVEAIYPLGTLEAGTRAYASALEAAKGSRPLSLEARLDVLHVTWKRSCSGEAELEACLKELSDWMGSRPGRIPPCPLPGMSYRLAGVAGELPRWKLLVSGPRPSSSWPALPVPASSGPSPEEEAPADPQDVLLELPAGSPDARRLLALWLDPEARRQGRYGPFTLVLPPLHPDLSSAIAFRRGKEEFLLLRASKDPGALLEWLRGGAGLGGLKPEEFESLRGRLLDRRLWSTAGSPLLALRAHAEGRLQEASPPERQEGWTAWACERLKGASIP